MGEKVMRTKIFQSKEKNKKSKTRELRLRNVNVSINTTGLVLKNKK